MKAKSGLKRVRSRQPWQAVPSGLAEQTRRLPPEPYAGGSVLSVGLLVMLAFVLSPVSLIFLSGRIGDCFQPPCGEGRPPLFVAYFVTLSVLVVALPFIGIRALFGDHLVAR